ncbi:hypothetical protein D3C76_1189000 [compost metagenome]
MAQNGQLPAFMPGELLHHHPLGFPATGTFAVLPVIQIAATGTQQWQRGNHQGNLTTGGRGQVTDRRKRIRQVRIHNRAILKPQHQSGRIQSGQREGGIIKLSSHHAPGM